MLIAQITIVTRIVGASASRLWARARVDCGRERESLQASAGVGVRQLLLERLLERLLRFRATDGEDHALEAAAGIGEVPSHLRHLDRSRLLRWKPSDARPERHQSQRLRAQLVGATQGRARRAADDR